METWRTVPTTPTARPLAKPEVWRPIFLKELERTFNVSKAAKKAGINRWTAYAARKENAEFAAAWDAALEACLDSVEESGIKRAKATSDTLVQFFLKAHRRGVYGDRLQLGGTGEDGALIVEHRELPASVAALRELTARLGLTVADAGPLLPAPTDPVTDGGPCPPTS